MEREKTRYVIFGAGAIGNVVGGLLAQAGLRVAFVARPAQAEAIRRGMIIKRGAEEIRLKGYAVTSASELKPESGDVIIITTKSQATGAALEQLLDVYDRSARVVCLQNGTRNEAIAARSFDNVYAGLVLISAAQLEPALVTLTKGREIAIGRYPSGVDSTSEQICDDLSRAGFDCLASAHVMAMKWGKLVANLNNATHTITGYFLELGLADPEMRRLMAEVREEGLRVLKAAGIAVEPPAGEPSPIRIIEMTEALRRPPKPNDNALNLPEEHRTYASMWQDLYLGRKSNEAEFLNGEIIELGRKLGLPTPYNSTLMEVVNRMFAEGLKPGIYTPGELRALIQSRVTGG